MESNSWHIASKKNFIDFALNGAHAGVCAFEGPPWKASIHEDQLTTTTCAVHHEMAAAVRVACRRLMSCTHIQGCSMGGPSKAHSSMCPIQCETNKVVLWCNVPWITFHIPKSLGQIKTFGTPHPSGPPNIWLLVPSLHTTASQAHTIQKKWIIKNGREPQVQSAKVSNTEWSE